MILPNEKIKAKTSNDFVTTRFCRVIQVEWSIDLCFYWNFVAGCLNSDRESDEGEQCQQVENKGDENDDHQRAGSDIIERVTHGDGQRHAAQPSAHQEPARDSPGDMHPFFGKCNKGGEDGGQRNAQENAPQP